MKPEANWTRREVLGLALPLALPWASGLAAAPAPVAQSLGRPAIATRRGEHAFLLGAARAGERLVAVGERGLVMASDDGGESWQQMPTPVSVTLTAVRFVDATHGVAVGHGGVVLLTTDGGAKWSLGLDGRRAAAIVLETAQAGQDELALRDAERLVADGPDKPFLDVLISSPRDVFAIGAYGLALASGDGGGTWSSMMGRLDNPRALHWYAIRRRGDLLVLAGEQGLALRSVDGGQRFERIETPYRGSFFTLELVGDNDLLLAGLRGNAWRSRDGGASWTQLRSPMDSTITTSLIGPGGAMLFGNQAGFVLRLVDDRLEPINTAPLPPINGLVAGDDERLIALTALGTQPVATTPA